MKKKILSLLLSLSLCLSLLPAALAQEGEPRQARIFYDPDTMLWGLEDYDDFSLLLLPAEYDYISPFSDDGFAVARKIITSGDDWHYDYCLVDQRGNFVLPSGKYDYIEMGKDGIALVRDLEDRRAYFRPADSTFITDFCFWEDYEFLQLGVNKKLVDGKELYGAVDRNGETVIPFAYDYISKPEPDYYEPHILYVEKDGKYGAFNYDGSLLRRCIYPNDTAVTLSLSLPAQMSEEEEMNALIAASQTWEPYHYDGDIGNGLWGYKPTQYDGEYPPYGSIFWAVFASAQPFDETGHAQVTLEDGQIGTIDQSGNFTPAPLNDRFSDVLSGSWYDRGVTTCAEQGVMVGTGEGLFSPNTQLSDPECLTLALRLYDLQRGGDGTLEKVPADLSDDTLPGPDKWYRDAVYTARQWGLEEADGFSVLVDLTANQPSLCYTSREVFARALAVASGKLEKKYDVPRIPDVEREYSEYLYGLYEAGILNGTDSFGTFQKNKELTRAECATMVARVLDPAQRLTSPPATPNGYEQAVIDLRTGFTYIEESERTYDTDDCTVFVYDRGGAMYSPKGNVTLIYKPGSALGEGTTIDCPIPNPMGGLHREPPEVMALSQDGKTFTYSYYYDDKVHTCVADLATGQTAESDGPITYENQLALMTQAEGYTIERQLEAPGCTVTLRWKPLSWWDDTRDYRLDILLKEGDGKLKRLLLPSTVSLSNIDRPTDRAPDLLSLSEDGRTLTYTYHFDEALEYQGEVLHEAGDYTYTADLTTGEVTAYIDPLSQLSISFYAAYEELRNEEGYRLENVADQNGPAVALLRSKDCEGDPSTRNYELYLVYKAALPHVRRLALPSTDVLPDGSAPTTQAPEDMRFYGDDGPVTFAYTYRFQQPLRNGSALLHDKGTYTYTVDLATGDQSVTLEDSYWKALADVTRDTDDHPFQLERKLETETCTIVAGMTKAIQYPQAVLALVYKDGSPMGAGEVIYLHTLSGHARYDSILPDSLELDPAGTTLTYTYHFDENQYAIYLSGLPYLNHRAGTYTYTVTLATGEYTASYAP